MTIEREVLDTDILIVGAGPAGLAAAYHLAQLISSDDSLEMPEVMLMEKGAYPGSHSLSGGVMDPRGLAELIPDFAEKGAPLEAKVSHDSFFYLKESGQIKAPFLPPPLKNHGNYVVSLNKLVGWLAQQVEGAGVDVFSGLAGFDLLVEENKVTGVQTVDMGLDKDGEPRSNFEPGSIIKAKVTILCEGVHGSLSRIAFEKIPSLKELSLPQTYLTGVKEVWEVPGGVIRPGEVVHTIGYPQSTHEYGGGWMYGMADNLVSVGLAIGLDSPDPTNDPHMRFQMYKNTPIVKRALQGGEIRHYGAKTIPIGGYYSMPKLYHDGLLLAGDCAGMLNARRLKGIHIAIKSGMLIAETIVDALKADDYSAGSLKGYSDRFERSWARKELYSARNFHAGFKGGLWAGMFHAGMQIMTGGRGLFDRREIEPDYKEMLTLKQYQQKFGSLPAKKEIKFDNSYTFDKVSDVYKSGTKHEEDQPSHLVISDLDICNSRCLEEYGNPCQHFCPAHVYEMIDGDGAGGKSLMLTPSNCVHCKTCDIVDPYQIIRWVTPQGGEGPNYTNC